MKKIYIFKPKFEILLNCPGVKYASLKIGSTMWYMYIRNHLLEKSFARPLIAVVKESNRKYGD